MNNPPPPPGAMYAQPPPPPPAAPPPKGLPKLLIPVVAVVVVVVVVLALLLTGVVSSPLHPSGSPSGSPGSGGSASNDVDSDQAVSVASSTESSTSGGPWDLVGLYAFSLHTGYGEWASNSSGSSCGSTTESQTIWIPPESGSVGAGTAPIWDIEYTNWAGELLVIGILNGSVAYHATESTSGTDCTVGDLQGLNATTITSVTAADTANANGGSTFLSQHPTASAEYDLVDPSTGAAEAGISGPTWEVIYTTCPLGSSYGAAGAAEAYVVNGTSGAYVEGLNDSDECGGSSSEASVAMTPGTTSTCTNAASTPATFYEEAVSITATSTTLTTANFGFDITTVTGTAVTFGVGTTATPGTCYAYPESPGWIVVLLSPSGTMETFYDYTWESTGTTLPVTISAGDALIVVSTSQLAGSGDNLNVLSLSDSPLVTGSVTL